ncbi:MAG: DHH family phosphoesterase [Promethearchaeota archaeon]|nr:MAG: DHH family phosphoesterase [Candidatus Lokiarchaeota archaeon]
MLKSRFENFLSFIENKKILITTHNLVDIDGLASCFALKSFLIQYFKNQQVSIYFTELSAKSKIFLKKFSDIFPKFDVSSETHLDFALVDVIIIVDTNSLNQIGLSNKYDILDLKIPNIVIDHHHLNEKSKGNPLNLTFENYSSTAEIILELFEYFNIQLKTSIKTLMAAAIITDSGFFKYANNKTIHNINKLIGEDVNFQNILILLKSEIDLSQKIAKIKGMQRVELIREGDYLIAITNVSSFGSSVASMLLKTGFDIAIVFSKEINKYRITARAKKLICLKTGLHLGKIFEEISEQYNGNGGGHDGAATLTVDKESDFNITQIIQRIKDNL